MCSGAAFLMLPCRSPLARQPVIFTQTIQLSAWRSDAAQRCGIGGDNRQNHFATAKPKNMSTREQRPHASRPHASNVPMPPPTSIVGIPPSTWFRFMLSPDSSRALAPSEPERATGGGACVRRSTLPQFCSRFNGQEMFSYFALFFLPDLARGWGFRTAVVRFLVFLFGAMARRARLAG